MAEIEAELQRLPAERHPRDLDGVADLLRVLGDLTTAEAAARGVPQAWLDELVAARRALQVRIAGEERYVAIEDAGRLRDALGTALPVGRARGLHRAGRRPARRPGRPLRPHARPVPAGRGRGPPRASASPSSPRRVQRLTGTGRLVTGEFRPGGSGQEWCDAEVLRSIRRRSLAKLRQEVEPVPIDTLARFTPVVAVGRRPAAAARTASSPSSSSWRARWCRPARWSRWCCPPGCATTPPRCSTS